MSKLAKAIRKWSRTRYSRGIYGCSVRYQMDTNCNFRMIRDDAIFAAVGFDYDQYKVPLCQTDGYPCLVSYTMNFCPQYYADLKRAKEIIYRLANRWEAYCHYMKETRHNWTEVRKIVWADNSCDSIQVSKLTGEERNVELVAPHGDRCF